MRIDLEQSHGVFFEESFEAIDPMEAALLESVDSDIIPSTTAGGHRNDREVYVALRQDAA
jgi:hypothetical protein